MDAKEFEKYYRDKSLTFEKETKRQEQKNVKCVSCYDSGFVWVTKDSISVWCYCSCKEGGIKKDCKDFKLPQYSASFDEYRIKPFPSQAFLPKIKGDIIHQATERMNAFKRDLEFSEKFWNKKE